MEITLNKTDMLLIAQASGTIAGIADSMNNGILPDKRQKTLYDVSEQLMGMLRTKVNDSRNVNPEKVINTEYFKLP